MKRIVNLTSTLALALSLIAFTGCGTTSGYKQADKTGEAIKDQRRWPGGAEGSGFPGV